MHPWKFLATTYPPPPIKVRLQVLNADEVIMEGKIKPYFVEYKNKEPHVLENR